MEIGYYIIFAICIVGVGYSSYNIGFKEGSRFGAGLMGDKLWSMGKPKKNDPNTRTVDLHKDSI